MKHEYPAGVVADQSAPRIIRPQDQRVPPPDYRGQLAQLEAENAALAEENHALRAELAAAAKREKRVVRVELTSVAAGNEKRPAPVRLAGGLVYDAEQATIRVGQLERGLTQTESRLMLALSKRVGEVVALNVLIAEIWGIQEPVCRSTVHPLRVNVSRLRAKILGVGGRHNAIENRPALGYRLRGLEDEQ